jgi:hypothetical protein
MYRIRSGTNAEICNNNEETAWEIVQSMAPHWLNILVDGPAWIVFVERCGDASPRYERLADGVDKGFT